MLIRTHPYTSIPTPLEVSLMHGGPRRIVLALAVLSVLALPAAPAVLAAPQLAIRSPRNAAEVNGSSVTVDIAVSDVTLLPPSVPWEQAGSQPQTNRPDQGHLLLMLDLWPPVISSTSEPYTFKDVP